MLRWYVPLVAVSVLVGCSQGGSSPADQGQGTPAVQGPATPTNTATESTSPGGSETVVFHVGMS